MAMWLLLGALWSLGLSIGFDRAIARRMGPVEKRLFRLCIMSTGLLLVALVPVAIYALFADGEIMVGLAAVALAGIGVRHVRRLLARRRRVTA